MSNDISFSEFSSAAAADVAIPTPVAQTPPPFSQAFQQQPVVQATPAPVVQAPQPVEPTSPVLDWGKIKDLTAGAVDSETSLMNILNERTELSTKVAAFDKIEKPVFANDLAAKINTLIAEGKDIDTIENFLRWQKTDVNAMPAATAVRAWVQDKFPAFNESEVTAYIEHELKIEGIDSPDGELSPASSMRLKTAEIEAKAALAQKKVAVGELPQQKPAMSEADYNAALDTARKAVSPIVETSKVEKIDIDFPEGKFALDYNFSPEALAFAHEQAAIVAANNPDGVDAAQMKDFVRQMAIAKDYQNILKSAVADAIASTREIYVKNYSGAMPERKLPVPQGSGQNTEVPMFKQAVR
jgi:hypothetical protein